MLIVISRSIKGVREKERIKELILGAIAGASLPNVLLGNIIFTFPERSLDQDKTKIRLIADRCAGEEIGIGEEKEIKMAMCLALRPVMDIGEWDITIRGFDVTFDNYC